MKRVLLIAAFLFSLCVPASSQFNGCSAGFCAPVSSGGVTPATCTFEAFATENAGTATGTYSSVSFGAAASNRVLAVVPVSRTTSTQPNPITGATIGSTGATQVTSAANDNGANAVNSDIWYASVPAGTSGTVTVNWTNANTRSGIALYSILTSTPTPHAGNNNFANGANSVTQSISVPTNGCGIVGMITQQTGNTLSFSAGATQDQSNALAGATNGFESGHTTTTGTVSVTASMTGTANTMAMSLASWGP